MSDGIIGGHADAASVFSNQIMNRLLNYIKDTRGELKYVSWPTRRQAIMFTIVVVMVSLLAAMFLGFFDYIFSLVLQKFIL